MRVIIASVPLLYSAKVQKDPETEISVASEKRLGDWVSEQYSEHCHRKRHEPDVVWSQSSVLSADGTMITTVLTAIITCEVCAPIDPETPVPHVFEDLMRNPD